jgi:hypothetical protein
MKTWFLERTLEETGLKLPSSVACGGEWLVACGFSRRLGRLFVFQACGFAVPRDEGDWLLRRSRRLEPDRTWLAFGPFVTMALCTMNNRYDYRIRDTCGIKDLAISAQDLDFRVKHGIY